MRATTAKQSSTEIFFLFEWKTAISFIPGIVDDHMLIISPEPLFCFLF
jgi:hypothetical protein